MQCEKYLELFPTSSQSLIKEYCDQLEKCKADCFIFVARKAVCFIESLFRVGFLSESIKNKQLYSSGCLDFMGNTFLGKKVAIIDDISNSGAAIAEIANILIDRFNVNPCDIEVIVLAVNSNTFSMDFTDYKTGYQLLNCNNISKLKSADCAELSKTIATSLCFLGIPYDSDFPAYGTVTVTNQQYHKLLSPIFWNCYDVSNQYHKMSGISALTLIPKTETVAEISQLIGIDLSNWVHLKIRIYAKQSMSSNWELQIVPMAIIKETNVYYVIKAYDSIFDPSNNDCSNATISGKTRFFQFLIAALVGKVFWGKEATLSTPKLDPTHCIKLFGIMGSNICTNYLNHALVINKNFKEISISSCSPFYGNSYTIDNQEENNYFSDNFASFAINEKLSEPIISWYASKEQSIRDEIRHRHFNYREYNRCEKSPFKKLNEGFSINSFYTVLNGFRDSYNIEDLVSVFLDRSIDLGFIVPITFENGNTTYRAFRHGEASQGIESDWIYLKLFIKLLKQKLLERNPAFHEISSIALEKIIVLFYKFASQDGLINNFLKFDNGYFLVEQHSLHGAIIAEQNFPKLVANDFFFHPYSEDDQYTTWLSKKLVDADCIVSLGPDPELGPYVINEIALDQNSVSETNYLKVEMYSFLFAEWYSIYSLSKANAEFRNSVVKLTSCENIDKISTSVLAEIQYCIRNWYGDIAEAKRKANEQKSDLPLINYLKDILKSKSFVGINSGIQKFKFYTMHSEKSSISLDGRFVMESTIEEIGNKLSLVNPIYKVYWLQFWAPYRSVQPVVNKSLEKLLIDSINYLYKFAVLYRSFHLVASDNIETFEIEDLLNQHIKTLSDFPNSVTTELYKRCSEIVCSSGAQMVKIDFLMSLFSKVVEDAEVHRDNVEATLSLEVYKHSEKYDGCMIINFYCDNSVLCKSILHNATSARKCYNELLAVEELCIENDKWCKRHPLRFYLFSNSKNNLSLLLEALDEIYEKAKLNHVNASFILIPKLPDGAEYVYWVNLKTDSANKLFRKSIVSKVDNNLESFYSGIVLVSPSTLAAKNYNYFDSNTVRKKLDQFITKEFYKDGIKINGGEDYTMDIFTTATKTIGIITIRDDETKAVIEQFGMVPQKKGDYIYYSSEVLRENVLYQFCLRRQLDKGNAHAGVALDQLIKDWDIDCAVLLGVAGSVKPEEADICDVVIADKIVDLTYGAETEGGFVAQTNMPEIDPQLIERIHNFQTMIYGKTFPNPNYIPDGKSAFKVIVGPIGDSGRVVKADHAESRELLTKYINSSVVAVDTESAGFAISLRSSKLSSNSIIGPLIIRGISDAANAKKDKKDTYHFTAAKNAATILNEIFPYIVYGID